MYGNIHTYVCVYTCTHLYQTYYTSLNFTFYFTISYLKKPTKFLCQGHCQNPTAVHRGRSRKSKREHKTKSFEEEKGDRTV